MDHEDGSVQAPYSHVTGEMVRRLLDGLTALAGGAGYAAAAQPASPVTVLDQLLTERA